jgi:hypothetical protein
MLSSTTRSSVAKRPRGRLLAHEAAIEAVRRGRLPDDVVGEHLERRLDLTHGLAVEVVLHGGQVPRYGISIHLVSLVCWRS